MASEHSSALRKPFLTGVVAVVILFVFAGGLIAVFGVRDERPEGVAERWLTSVADTTRDGVKDDARARVADHGDVQLMAFLIGQDTDMDGKAAFTELEVGKARKRDGATVVPYHVKTREGTSSAPDGVLVMSKDRDDNWFVTSLAPRNGMLVPSEGGPSVSEAPITLYVAALVVGALIAVGCSALVRAATPRDMELTRAA